MTATTTKRRGRTYNLVFGYILAIMGLVNLVLFIAFSIADFKYSLLINLFIGLLVIFQSLSSFRRYYRPYSWELQ